MTPYHWVGMFLGVISMVAYVTLTYANLKAQSRRGTAEAKAANTTALSAVRDAAVAHRDAKASHMRLDELMRSLANRWDHDSRELATVAANLAAFDKAQGAALGLIYERLHDLDKKVDRLFTDGCARRCA